jgi:hypothetical protein
MRALQGTHTRGRQTGALSELFLREPGSRAQPANLISECGRCAVGDVSHPSVYAAGAPDGRHRRLQLSHPRCLKNEPAETRSLSQIRIRACERGLADRRQFGRSVARY